MKSYFLFILINIIIFVFTNEIIEEIPDFFDSRKKWPNCISKIYNQGTCGACYAFSTATTFSMRFCIKNNSSQIINFSPQHLVNCLSGCKGEFPDIVWDYINQNGITTEECLSYQQSGKSCTSKCDSNENEFKKYYSGKTKFLESEESIKKEIMKNGPVTSMMYIYNDYYDYKSGIYIHNGGDNYLGFHAISIIGWGIEDNIKYWIIQDSYGISHGEKGYLRIKIGDKCGAGETAFCDEINGKYIIDNDKEENNENEKDKNNYNENDNNEKNNSNIYSNKQNILFTYNYLLYFIILFLI